MAISVSNPFRAYRRSFTEINDPAFYLFRESYSVMRRYHVSFNYRFGKVQGDISRQKRRIKNDNVKANEQKDPNLPHFLMPPVVIEDSRSKDEGRKE